MNALTNCMRIWMRLRTLRRIKREGRMGSKRRMAIEERIKKKKRNIRGMLWMPSLYTL